LYPTVTPTPSLPDALPISWKQGLDVYSCTECGRCQTHCPTYLTGKPLTHKGVNQDIKHWLWDHQQLVGEGKKPTGEPFEPEPLVDRKSTRLNSSHLGISYA